MSTGTYIALGVVAVIVIIILICLFAAKPAVAGAGGSTGTSSAGKAGDVIAAANGGTITKTNISATGSKSQVATGGITTVASNSGAYPSTIAATNDDYLYWATGMAAYMAKYSNNPQLTSQFDAQLSAAVSNFLGLATSYGVRYTTDTQTVGNYNQNYPNLTCYPSLTAAVAGNKTAMYGANGTPLTTVTTLTPQVVFHNMVNIMATIAKNNVQANTEGQAIGAFQGRINADTNTMNNQEDTEENIPSYAQQCVLDYTYSLAPNDWPAGVQSGSQINEIVGGIVAAVGIVLVATGVGTAIGAAVVSVGVAVAKIPN